MPQMSAPTRQRLSPSSAPADLNIVSDFLESSEFRLSFALPLPPAPFAEDCSDTRTTFRSADKNVTPNEEKSKSKGSRSHRRSASAPEVETLLNFIKIPAFRAAFEKNEKKSTESNKSNKGRFTRHLQDTLVETAAKKDEEKSSKRDEASEGNATHRCVARPRTLIKAAATDSESIAQEILPAARIAPKCCTTTGQQQKAGELMMTMTQHDDTKAAPNDAPPALSQLLDVQKKPIIGRLNDLPGERCAEEEGFGPAIRRGSPWIRPNGRKAKDSSYYFHGGSLFDASHLLAAMDDYDSDDDDFSDDEPDLDDTDVDTSSKDGDELR